ncbi:hypothetical protein HHI36_001330 [Cryptolaemus montrouzieri]|uniref:Uncharacterized protein n=1 Tax=Cryptolaemus montrouzieri TaxID=559131 RepID=A0ABD2P7J1_9CUCU
MIADTCLDNCFWGEAILTATFLTNFTPTKALRTYSKAFDTKNDESDIRSESLAKFHVSDKKSDKIESVKPRSETGASDIVTKPIDKSDIEKSNKTESVIETDGYIWCLSEIEQLSELKSDIAKSDSIKSVFAIDEHIELRKSDRIKGHPGISYIEDDYLLYAHYVQNSHFISIN